MSGMPERVALGALVVLTTSNLPLGRVADVMVRPDLVGGALAVVVVLGALVTRRRLPTSHALYAFGGFVALQILGSVLNARAWPQGPKFSALYVLALATVWAVLVLVRDRETLRWTLSFALAVAAVVAAVTVLAVLSSNLIGVPRLTPVNRRWFLRAQGLMSEANLFSSLLLVPFAVALWRWSETRASTRWYGATCTALGAALVFGLTRAAWVAAIAIVWLSPLRRAATRRRLWWLAGGVVAAAAALFVSDVVARHGTLERTGFYDRLATGLVTARDEPLTARREELRTGLTGWLESPWFGHGTGSAKMLRQRSQNPRYFRPEAWISNAELFVLHDGGLVGLGLFLTTIGLAALQWGRARRALGAEPAALDHEALGVGLAGVLIAWQATHALWQMYGYLYLGLLLASCRLAERAPGAAAPR